MKTLVLTPADGDVVAQLHLGVLHREGGNHLHEQVETCPTTDRAKRFHESFMARN
jgi:hypothetical protein